jgi:uncharacterized membrane protein YdbT with pleckstrin-like domain
MAYPEKLLAPNEHVKFQMRPHWRALFGPILILVATVFVGTFLFVSAPWPWLQWVVGAVMALLILWPALLGFLRWVTTDYVFTDRRIIVRSGILTKRGRDVPLSKINNVSFEVPVLGRLLNYGTLDIQSAGENEGLRIEDVPDVEHIQRDVYELTEVDDARRRSGGTAPSSDGT